MSLDHSRWLTMVVSRNTSNVPGSLTMVDPDVQESPMSLNHSRWSTLPSRYPPHLHRWIFFFFFFPHFTVIPWIAEASSNQQNKTKQNKKRLKKFGLYHQSRTPQCPGRLLFYRPGGYTTCINTLIFPPKHHPVDHGICPEAYSRQKV